MMVANMMRMMVVIILDEKNEYDDDGDFGDVDIIHCNADYDDIEAD